MPKNYGTKKCQYSNCRKKYYPTVNTQIFCSPDCAKGQKAKDKKASKARKQATREKVLKRQEKFLTKEYIRGSEKLADYLGVSHNECTVLLSKTLKDIPHESANVSVGKTGSEFFYKKEDIEKFFTSIGYVKPIDRLITVRNYKEPLTSVEGGYGYLGTISQTEDGEYIQCHICGKLMKHMSGHIWQTHKMRIRDYKEKFGISYSTGLASEQTRWELKRKTIEWVSSLSGDEKAEFFKQRRERLLEGRKKRKLEQPKKALEAYNKEGTCPQQLLAKIQEVAADLGHTPSLKEFVAECGTQRFKHLIIKTHGSWLRGVELAGLKPKEHIQNGGMKKKWDDEELLEYLKVFAEENNQIPTHTDFCSGFLPDEAIYVKRFGSIDKAREMAGVYDIVDSEILNEFRGKAKKKLPWSGIWQAK